MKAFINNFFIVLILFNIILPCFAQQTGNNTVIVEKYLPPDIYWPEGKRYSLKKLDINTISLEQLQMLPNIDEDFALKIILKRPVKSLDQLYNLPYLNMNRTKLIIEDVSAYFLQPLKEVEELKQ